MEKQEGEGGLKFRVRAADQTPVHTFAAPDGHAQSVAVDVWRFCLDKSERERTVASSQGCKPAPQARIRPLAHRSVFASDSSAVLITPRQAPLTGAPSCYGTWLSGFPCCGLTTAGFFGRGI